MILAIETSTEVCSTAVLNNGKLIAEDFSHQSYSHAERLAPMIKSLLEANEIPRSALTAVAVSSGPGSYTGLRIGTSTAKGLCYALDIPLIAVNTLESMLQGLPDEFDGYFKCPMIDARRMEVYCLLSDDKDEIISRVEARVIDEYSFAAELNSAKILFYGNGANKCKTVLDNTNARFLENITPQARNIGQLAVDKFSRGDFADLAYFEPDYLKPYIAIKAKNPLG